MVIEHFISAVTQVLVVLLLALAVYFFQVIALRKTGRQDFRSYLGLSFSGLRLDRGFWALWIGVVALGMGIAIFQFRMGGIWQALLLSDSSPYGKILKNGFGFSALVSGFIYSFFQAAASEEMLFRGLIAKRLYAGYGPVRGNVMQAVLFWLMHFVIFRLVTGSWVSWVQLFAFFVSFGLGLILGFANFRKAGQSILPSWILHGSMNLASFLALGVMLHFCPSA